MTFKKHIPNLITLLNLLSGTIAVYFAAKDQLILAAFFVFLGIFLDFFDGFAARLLNVQAELGKQLDSLADVVTSGVAPGIIMFQLLLKSVHNQWVNDLSCEVGNWITFEEYHLHWLPFLGLLITLASAYRLAKFNIDKRQTSSFIGLPTPAAALVVVSLPLILVYSNNEYASTIIENSWFLITLTVVLSYLMNAEIPLFSLKFKNYSWATNKIKYLFIFLTIILSVLLQFIAIPIVIVLYVVLSLITKEKSKS
ncbi:MAG: CDP-alcohol phosphatidyltransferase family protein [Lutibacter sp.]|uniref:CDP-alcohol phosphatidyltransferase family protein n=1 Tax=Lutibacter sp. TaxID=1925666 RepID=UPI00385B575C